MVSVPPSPHLSARGRIAERFAIRIRRYAARIEVRLWSYNYSPEPTGIAPLSAVWAEAMAARGNEVDVVAAHPHYPEAEWGMRWRPYREVRNGIPVRRWPLWIGRRTTLQRIRQELSYALSHTLAVIVTPRSERAVVVTPSFPALGPTLIALRVKRVPWVLWLQDILPDGATATGMVKAGLLISLARRLERAAYRSANHIVVISDVFAENLIAKGVPAEKITRIYNPCTAPVHEGARRLDSSPPRVFSMGNIGHSQGLDAVVTAFEASERLAELGVRLVINGAGVAERDVADAIAGDRVEMTGILGPDQMEAQFDLASLALVSQRAGIAEFNMPSKLMNFMAQGLPVLALAKPGSELERVVLESGCGWVMDNSKLELLGETVAAILADPDEMARRALAGRDFAREHFTADAIAAKFETILARL